MKIHIFGASGSGVTTLGQALALQMGYPYFDNDSYFWKQSDPPFTIKRLPEKRNAMLLNDLSQTANYIVGGSMVSWGDEWLTKFDLVIFILLPPEIRIERLQKREFERYGPVIHTDPDRIKKYNDFMIWASGYDNSTTMSQSGNGLGRTLKVHLDWMDKLKCPILKITGNNTVEHRIQQVLNFIKTNL